MRRWEQAFRIYATIYSQANPQRSSEIFQYMNTINHAARSFAWECVEYYDFTFRQMMARKPNRSWSKGFPELWTMAMTEPLSKNSGQTKKKDWRDNCCWKFNKGSCRLGPACRFEHKCTYCGSTTHPRIHCYRKPSGERRGESDRGGSEDHHRNDRRRDKGKKRGGSHGNHDNETTSQTSN